MPAPIRLRARSDVSVSAGLIRNQLATIATTQPRSDSTIHVSLISHTSSDIPTMPMPSTQTNVSAGSTSRRCSLATVTPAPARCIDG